MTVPQVPQASLVCQVLKGTKVSRESQGEKAQKGKRYGDKGKLSFCHCNGIHHLGDLSTTSRGHEGGFYARAQKWEVGPWGPLGTGPHTSCHTGGG